MDALSAAIAWALLWLPRLAIIFLAFSAFIWVADKGVSWLVPRSGDPAPEFEAGSADQNALLARLLQAEFMRIKTDLVSGSGTMTRLLKSWTSEFEEINRKKQSGSIGRKAQPTAQGQGAGESKVTPFEIKPSVDLASLSASVEKLTLLSSTINTTKVPDINIASVELGPVLRWLVSMFRPPGENKVAIFDENSVALIEGPIVSSGRIVVEMEPPADAKKHTARQLVEPVAYQILASKLASAEPKIDFGSWSGLRDFVVGTRNMAKLVSQPQPGQEDRADWDKQVSEAAQLITRAGAASRDWKFIALASFLFERSRDFDNAIRVLDRYAEFARGDKENEAGREARLAHLRDRRVESAIAKALDSGKGEGVVFAATANALASLPSIIATRKLHRLDGETKRASVKIAIVGGAKPRWFGLDGPPERFPAEEFLDQYGAGLAEVVRALSPAADVTFFPIQQKESDSFGAGAVTESELFGALDQVAKTDIPIVLLPFGPISGKAWTVTLERLLATGHLVILPAGNTNESMEDRPIITQFALVAESIGLDGKRSSYSLEVKGGLGAVGELPIVDLTDAGPTVAIGTGTSYAAAALAAVAVESVARQPKLRGAALRDALIKAAAEPKYEEKGPPIARVVIPR